MNRLALRATWGLAVLAIFYLTSTAHAVYYFSSFDGSGNNGGGTTVDGINNAGAVVGFSADNAANPTLLTNFVRNSAGSFTNLNLAGNPLADANGINDANLVVGTYNNNAFLLSNNFNTLTLLPQVNPGQTSAEVAFGLNNNRTIVGQYTDSTLGTTRVSSTRMEASPS